MIVSIHQPNFSPWSGYFSKILNSDVFLVLDNVKFSKGSYTNRSEIKFSDGSAKWLTVPVDFEGSGSYIINKLKTSQKVNWKRKHLEAFKSNYSKARFYSEIMDFIKPVYERNIDNLSEFNTEIILAVLDYLNIKKEIFFASRLQSDDESDLIKNDRLIDLIQKTHCSTYLSGKGAKDYNDEDLFKKNNIHLTYTDFKISPYPQLYGEFIGGLSILDLLFNCGKESVQYLKNS